MFVDLRSRLSVVRDQGARPLCMICAASDIHEVFHSTGFPLSAEYLAYYCQVHDGISDFLDGFGPKTVSNVMSSHGQPSEAFHPYADKELVLATKPSPIGSEPLYFGKLADESLDINRLIDCLDNHQAVLVGVKITEDFFDVTSENFIVNDTKGYGGYHAMVAVGYGDYNENKVFLLRNSWGMDWGYQGYAWVGEDYLTKYCLMMACVESR